MKESSRMDTVRFSETSVNFYHVTRINIAVFMATALRTPNLYGTLVFELP